MGGRREGRKGGGRKEVWMARGREGKGRKSWGYRQMKRRREGRRKEGRKKDGRKYCLIHSFRSRKSTYQSKGEIDFL